MADIMRLNSRVIKYTDYHTIDIRADAPSFTPDEAQIEKDMDRVRRAHGSKMSAQIVENGDMVQLKCQSENAKFNREKIMVMTGKNLYSKELEAQLVGMEKGKTYAVQAENSAVSVTVLEITHNVLPELTDAVVASWDMEQVKSVADLRRWCINKQIDQYMDEDETGDQTSAKASMQILETCEVELDPEEAKWADVLGEETVKRIESERDKNGITDDMEEYGGHDWREFARNMYRSTLKIAVLGQYLLEQKGELHTTEDYDAYLIRMAAGYQITIEEAKDRFQPIDYLSDVYADYYINLLDAYVRDSFKSVMNP